MHSYQRVPKDYNKDTNWHQALKQFDIPNDFSGHNISKKHKPFPSSHGKLRTGSSTKWAPRILVVTGCLIGLGNIPLQSQPTQVSTLAYSIANSSEHDSSDPMNGARLVSSRFSQEQTEDPKSYTLNTTKVSSAPVERDDDITESAELFAAEAVEQPSHKDTLLVEQGLTAQELSAEPTDTENTLLAETEQNLPSKALASNSTSISSLSSNTFEDKPDVVATKAAETMAEPLAESPKEILAKTNKSIIKPKQDDLVFTKDAQEHIQLATKEQPSNTLISRTLPIPKAALETFSVESDVDSQNKYLDDKWRTYITKSKDTIDTVARHLKVKSHINDMKKNSRFRDAFSDIKTGTIIRVKRAKSELLEMVLHKPNNKKSHVISQTGDDYKASYQHKVIEVRQSRKVIAITNSWRFNANEAQLSSSLIKQVSAAFDQDIKLSSDLRKGDRVTLIFNEAFHHGAKIATLNLLGAELIIGNRTHRAIRYTSSTGKTQYFTPEGSDLGRSFLQHPINARITSNFSFRRFHPILRRHRPHTGVDYGAKRGSPVKVTANGVVKYAARKGGYGKTVIVQHSQGYTTSYSHLKGYAKNIRPGKRVYIGQVIGYVGNTGRSTGPHLHYEVRLKGKPLNPKNAKLPRTRSLNKPELRRFKEQSQNLVLQLNVLQRFAEAEVDISSGFGG